MRAGKIQPTGESTKLTEEVIRPLVENCSFSSINFTINNTEFTVRVAYMLIVSDDSLF